MRFSRWFHTRLWQTGLKSGFQLLLVWGWMLGVMIVVALLSFYRPLQTQQLLTTQVTRQKHLGDETLNALLYEYQRKHAALRLALLPTVITLNIFRTSGIYISLINRQASKPKTHSKKAIC